MKATKQKYQFICPNDGVINRDEVLFLCNRCHRDEVIYKDGFYLCPRCEDHKQGSFGCKKCGSRKVVMKEEVEA